MYKFNLEALLKHRKYLEDLCQKECSEVEQKMIKETEQMEKIEMEQLQTQEKFIKAQEDMITSPEMIMYTNYFQKLKTDLLDQKKRVDRARLKLKKSRTELVEAMQKRKTLEHLKEKGLKAYREKIIKKEQDFLDEIAVNSFGRNKE